MNISEQQIQSIVQNVIGTIIHEQHAPKTVPAFRSTGTARGKWGVFAQMNEAVTAAHEAFTKYQEFGVQDRERVIAAIRATGLAHKEELSRMVFDETGMGRYKDKIDKHVFASKSTPGTEELATRAFSGKNGVALEEYAPYGVIGSITPSTHPSETIINNSIMMLAAGNTVVFGPHPSAKKVSAYTVELLNRAIRECCGLDNLVTTVESPSIDSAKDMFGHPLVGLLSITGGPMVVKSAMQSSKKVIAAGPGNPPVVIDESADCALAAARITKSASFDNNILCTAEKEVFVVDSVFDRFMQEMQGVGNVKLNKFQIDQLAGKVFQKTDKHYVVSRDYVGKNASVLAKAIGITVSDNVPLLFGETSAEHLFVEEEQMMPFLPVVKVKSFEDGVRLALHAEHGYRHTASCFTGDMVRATSFARKANCSIFVINGGTYQGNGSDDGEGNLSFTIATPTGEAITRPHNFARLRRIMTAGAMRFV